MSKNAIFYKNTSWVMIPAQSFLLVRGGQAIFVLKLANRKSANSWAHSDIAKPQLFKVCQSSKIAYPKYYDYSRNPKYKNFYEEVHNSVSKQS